MVVGHAMFVERLGGIGFRPNAVASISAIRGKEHREFEEFYAEQEHGAAALEEHRARTDQPRHFHLKAAIAGTGVTTRFLPAVATASVLPNRTTNFHKTGEKALFAIVDALHREYTAVIESGLPVRIDDAFPG